MSNIVAKTEELVKPICEASQVDLVDVEYVKEGQNFFLRVYVDTPEGIDIDQCATIAEAFNQLAPEATLCAIVFLTLRLL